LHSAMVLGSGSTRTLSAMMVEKHGLTIVVLQSYNSPKLVYLMKIPCILVDVS
jgi:hypothetical protein